MFFSLTAARSVMGRGIAADAGVMPTQDHVRDQIAGIVSQLREQNQPLTIAALWETGKQQGLHPQQIADLSGQDLRGFTFTQKDLDALRNAAGSPSMQLNLKGANICDTVFHPASTFNGVIIDECTIADTNMQNLHFVGLSGEQANLDFSGVSGLDVSGLTVSGAKADSPARNVNISLNDACATDMQLGDSRLLTLSANDCNMDGLNAAGARALKLDVQGGSLQGANFEGASFAPGSCVHRADLRGASFAGADVSELSLTGSHMNAQGLIGAYYKGTAITTETAAAVAAEKGLTLSDGEAVAQRQWPATPGADSFEAQLVAARGGAEKTRGGEGADASDIRAQTHLAQFRTESQGAALGA